MNSPGVEGLDGGVGEARGTGGVGNLVRVVVHGHKAEVEGAEGEDEEGGADE